MTTIARRPAGTATARLEQLAAVTATLEPPYAVVDLDAFDANAAELTRRASGNATIRLASKSVRARALMERTLARAGYDGTLGFTLAEAIWLAEKGGDSGTDIVIGYPTADRHALRRLAADDALRDRITLMVDSTAHLDFLDATLGRGNADIKLCIDLDASLELANGRVHLGPYRSPTRTPQQAAALAQAIVNRQGFMLDGLMSYEGQIAGLGDNQDGSRLQRLAIRTMQRLSARELGARRAEVVAAVNNIAALRFVNGGGTGSIEQTSSEQAITEIGAGSGLYGPGLFDHYRHFAPRHAAFFVLSVVRRPTSAIATALGGGWVASGPSGVDRLPKIAWPPGLRMSPREAAGEVQTPLLGTAASSLQIGDQVWMRHSKAGELCEHVNELHLVAGEEIVDQVPTYRGEGRAFL
jgi:D-serine deaminase-like pyridoxal phosphate-dependent protein